MKYLITSVVLLATICMLLSSVEAKIFVVSPLELADKFKERTIEGTLSKFGRIPYGFSIVGNIVYQPDKKTGKYFGCDSDAQDSSGISLEFDSDYSIDGVPFLMIDRGSCTFVKKVENAELRGALAAIIVDKIDEQSKVMMADDGKGNNITIPAILIGKSDGDIIKKYLEQNPEEKVFMEIDFEMVSSVL